MLAWVMNKSAQSGFFRLFFIILLIYLLFLPSSCTNKSPTLGTRGYIPDISPRGYGGLAESRVVLPKTCIAELVPNHIASMG